MTTRKDIKKLLKPSNNSSLWRLITDNHFDLLHKNVRENQRSNHERENQRHMQLWAINIVYHLNVFNKKANHEMCYKMKFQIGFLSVNILVVYIL
jgi:hypothetical protein